MGTMMLDQNLFNIVITSLGALCGWWMKTMWESLQELRISDTALHKALQISEREMMDKLSAIEILVAGKYIQRDEMHEHIKALFAKLDKIEIKLDGKVDKTKT